MNPLEEQEQVVFVQWLELMGLKFSAVPSSTFTKSWSVKNRNTRMGVRAGVPDLLIALPDIGVIFIELKRRKGGVVSKAQQEWVDTLNACPGTQAFVCKGADEAIKVIESFTTIPAYTGTDALF